ncbi:E3 ubiquitin-protein ligase DCST1 [Thalassophryne amazonica]|uniref:E3 ubiquitin-protein ligase DCST1 n=1 Tax=Thalassophryne amazonica TaxID=390379 RepID=UPI0014726380|nr:E3 ubiquitin-protein ligase DCST1 [Thalassophryne amazonica]
MTIFTESILAEVYVSALPALEKVSEAVMPPVVHHFLFSKSGESSLVHHVLRALFGAVCGSVLFLGVAYTLPLTFDLKLTAGCVFVVICILGGALSSGFRCSILLTFPSMLGSCGRRYLLVFILSVLLKGPVSNIQKNIQLAALSVGCNLDLQVHNGKLLWRDTIQPFIKITQELMDEQADFQHEAHSVNSKFQSIRDQVLLQYGYDGFITKAEDGSSTQEQFTAKTMKQCDTVVEYGVQRCADWFLLRWQDCVNAIKVPVLNHIFCAPMKLQFLCDVQRVMVSWCKEEIPVEENFGQLFDKLDASVNQLSTEFTAKVVLEEQDQQSILGEALLEEEFSHGLNASFHSLITKMDQALNVLQMLLSFTFITFFTSAFGYVRQYRRDVRFDNFYVSTYFRQIDARRKKAAKCCLLPLKTSERKKFIFPWSPRVHPEELKEVMAGVFQVVYVSVLVAMLLVIDLTVFHVLDIVSRNTFNEFNLTSNHEVNINVEGDSMMARLLRKTFSAFNSSSNINIQTDNQKCVATPTPLSAGVYVTCIACILLEALFSCLQVYTNRLRRVIAAFFHPKREKKRILYLYNLQIQKRISSGDPNPSVEEAGT